MQKYQQLGMVSILMVLLGFSNAICTPRTIYVRTAPPAVRVEVKPVRPFNNAVWKPGHWIWKNNSHVWISGHWVKPRKGYTWIPGYWVKKRRGWVWMEGHWKKL